MPILAFLLNGCELSFGLLPYVLRFYPGGSPAGAFVAQLTQYTTKAGLVQTSKDSTYKYGPYIKGSAMPTNPFTSTSTLVCDFDEAVITTRTPSGSGEAWRFFPITGVFIANDTTAHAAY